MFNLRTIPRWERVRTVLKSTDPRDLRQAAVSVGKFRAEDIPDDIVDGIINLFRHRAPEVRAEAIRALGLHWRVQRVLGNLLELLQDERDWHVQISAIDALGALGREYPDLRSAASRALATVSLDSRFADDERMLAYRELLFLERKLSPRDYRRPNPTLTDQLARFEVDRSWIEDLATQKSDQS